MNETTKFERTLYGTVLAIYRGKESASYEYDEEHRRWSICYGPFFSKTAYIGAKEIARSWIEMRADDLYEE